MALLFVLWVMAILSAVALEVRFSSHLHMQITANIGNEMKAFFYARAGVERAISDLLEESEDGNDAVERRVEDEATYCDVPIGDGFYTLYAGVDDEGVQRYGLMDQCASININTADESVLANVPELGDALAADMVALRDRQPLQTLDELLAIENVTPITVYGEDQNRNGILDPNENDGDTSWPPDNADDRLDGGLAGYLTLWSAARNVTVDGEPRIKLNKAAAEEITRAISAINEQQAQAIVAHRDKSQFKSVADLLDVELVEITGSNPQQPNQKSPEGQPPGGNEKQEKESAKKKDEQKKSEGNKTDEGKTNTDAQAGDSKRNDDSGRKKDGSASKEKESAGKPNVRFTGVKAFDPAALKNLADHVTASDEDSTPGLININTAPAEVLACLPGLEEELARAIVSHRQGRKDYYKTVADILDVDGVSTDTFKNVCRYLTARSDVFEARSFGNVGRQDLYRCVSAVLERQESKVRICAWRELE